MQIIMFFTSLSIKNSLFIYQSVALKTLKYTTRFDYLCFYILHYNCIEHLARSLF
ncbi:MAG: hypothetical protein JWQ06_1705 [Mucilaginibacter sp.]|nr:hypothetical protein [Mucilaginibacter sp.]